MKNKTRGKIAGRKKLQKKRIPKKGPFTHGKRNGLRVREGLRLEAIVKKNKMLQSTAVTRGRDKRGGTTQSFLSRRKYQNASNLVWSQKEHQPLRTAIESGREGIGTPPFNTSQASQGAWEKNREKEYSRCTCIRPRKDKSKRPENHGGKSSGE